MSQMNTDKMRLLVLLVAGLCLNQARAEWTAGSDQLLSVSESGVADSLLDDQRGREGLDPLALGRGMSATLGTTTAISSNVTTSNTIDSGAFANASGLVSVIQNTGNNVIIQDSTLVNIRISP
jgi:hypothetical protein